MTLVLMFRSVGSAIFGIAADRYGRKWPFIVNNVLFIILELVSLDAQLLSFVPLFGLLGDRQFKLFFSSRTALGENRQASRTQMPRASFWAAQQPIFFSPPSSCSGLVKQTRPA